MQRFCKAKRCPAIAGLSVSYRLNDNHKKLRKKLSKVNTNLSSKDDNSQHRFTLESMKRDLLNWSSNKSIGWMPRH